MTLQDLTPAIAERLGVEETTGVIVTGVEGNSPAARAGLKPGMVIRQVNRQDVSDAAQAVDALQNTDKEKGVLLLVQTDAGSRFVVVEG
jgi:serine protease Do